MALFNPYAKGFNQPVDAIPGRGWMCILAGTTINILTSSARDFNQLRVK